MASTGAEQPQRTKLTPIWVLKATRFINGAALVCIVRYLPVFYLYIGLDSGMIGIMTFVNMGAMFVGQLFWSSVIDCTGEYKSVWVSTQFAAIGISMFYMVPMVQSSVPLLLAVAFTTQFLMSTSGSVIDALAMTVLKDYKSNVCPTSTPHTVAGSETTYADIRLYSSVGWGIMSFVVGYFIDAFGLNAMFAGFGILQSINMGLVIVFMPSAKKERSASDAGAPTAPEQNLAEAPEETGLLKLLCNPVVALFFANLFMYGLSMCLVENFLFVYLVEDFDNVTNVLLGISTTVMCIAEIPAFKLAGPIMENLPAGKEKALLFAMVLCQLVTVLRCWLYAIMPRNMAWMMVVVGALHCISLSVMWVAAMEYVKRLANSKTLARMTSLTTGIYCQLSMAIGSLMWGQVVETPPKGLGFRTSFNLDAACLAAWSGIFLLGVLLTSKRQVAAENADMSSALASS